ncbi:MAG: phosphoadenylyl-sulfate reductase [Gammaproteobacteria bacterium]|nr:MAG: phosphoadenylyl-sulfate reductase [Gammaproteobacteria bacterium]
MAELAALGLERKAAAVHAQLAAALARHGRLVYSNSLGAEAMVLTDIIATQLPEIDMFSIDTGRLYEETHELLEKLQRRYRRAIRVVYPDAAALERLVARQGVNGFYHSLEARLECCRIRKVEPFKRAIAGYDGWITGLRREQSAARAATEAVEWDAEHGLYKVSPLLEWTEADWWWEQPETRECGLHPRVPPAALPA